MHPDRSEHPVAVVHFGNDPASVRGGIASVIRTHLASASDGLSVSAVPTYDPAGADHWRRNRPYLGALGSALRLPRRDGAVAHVHISRGGSLVREGVLIALLRLRRVPVVVTLHGSSSLTGGGLPFLLTGLVLRCATVAHFLSEAHRRRYGRMAGRHVTVPNVVEVDPNPGTDKQPDVVFAGVVGTRKGVDLLLEAWRSVPSGDWRLHLYGPIDGDFRLPDGVPGLVVHGEVAPDVVQSALGTASVAVLPSREEAFPMFLLEAMAHRCAIVATDVGGVRELMDDAGVLVPSDDAGALGAALTRLVTDPEVRGALAAAAGRRAAEKFDAAVISRSWADTYAALADGAAVGVGGATGAR